jgi:transcription initiation factor TFIIB
MVLEVEDVKQCPECESTAIVRDYQRGELVCDDCGLVLDEGMIDGGQDWNAYSPEEHRDKCRTGSPMTFTLSDKGLSTEIGWADRDINGRTLDRRSRADFHRLRRVNRRTKAPTTSEQNIVKGLTELRKCAYKLGLPPAVKESAALIYRKAHGMRLTRGRTIRQICAGATYAACRQHQLPRTLDEVGKAFGLKKREVGRGFNCIVKELGLTLERNSVYSYIPRYCDELKLNNGTPSRVREIVAQAEDAGLVDGKSPLAVIGAAIYIASYQTGHPRTQAEVAEVTQISEVTIRNRYKELAENLGITIDNVPRKHAAEDGEGPDVDVEGDSVGKGEAAGKEVSGPTEVGGGIRVSGELGLEDTALDPEEAAGEEYSPEAV